MKEITMQTKIATLLNEYEGMKDFLISINPKFEKLNNPILRRTIAKVASVKQAAIVGGMEPMELLNILRKRAGQEPIETKEQDSEKNSTNTSKPSWAKEPSLILDANKILEEEKNPLVEINNALKKLNSKDVILLKADFKPEPLIDELLKKGHQIYCEEINKNSFDTYIKPF